MLFHIKQSHTPENCPYGKGGSRSLFDYESKDVKIHGYWLAFPQHTIRFHGIWRRRPATGPRSFRIRRRRH